MKLRRSFFCGVVAMMLVAPVAARAGTFTCEVAGESQTFQIRRIVSSEERGMDLDLYLSDPRAEVTDRSNYHTFAGVWLLRARDLRTYSYIFGDDTSVLAPPHVNITAQGREVISQPVPSTDEWSDGLQGRYAIGSILEPDTYYLVGFGDGAGAFKGVLTMGGIEPPVCEDVSVPGRVVSFNAGDFQGGTQIRYPGHGYAQDATLSFTNPHSFTIGALYAYEPSPFPEATMRITTDTGTGWHRNDILDMSGPQRSYDLTLNYTGKTNTILIEALQIDLPAG